MPRPILLALLSYSLLLPVHAEGLITLPRLSLEMANEVAYAAVASCREKGWQVSVVVVDRNGVVQSVMRDALATRFNTEIATRKANAAVLSAVSTSDFIANRPDVVPLMNYLDDVLVLAGAVPIQASGSLLGAVGVSGARGGEIDEACAQEGVEAIAEELEFADL